MSDASEFQKDADELLNALAEKGAFLCDRADLYERRSDDDHGYYGYIKSFLVHDGTLCREMMTAINKGDLVLLVMSAARVVLEDLINLEYAVTRPNSEDRVAIAKDWLDRSNDRRAYKNKLDEKSVSERATLAGDHIKAVHDNEYATLCDYAHGGAQRSFLNMEPHRQLAGQKAIYSSLTAYANIVFAISALLSLPDEHNVELRKKVSEFLEKYKKGVAEATVD